MVEQRTHNPLVVGSNPTGPTRIKINFMKKEKMSKINLNAKIDPIYPVGHRDAIHVPLVKMTSYTKLEAGMKVLFEDDIWCYPVENDENNYDGIVNPFLPVSDYTAWILVNPALVDGTVQHFFQINHSSLTRQVITSLEPEECKGCYS